jgi:hypothetical protein
VKALEGEDRSAGFYLSNASAAILALAEEVANRRGEHISSKHIKINNHLDNDQNLNPVSYINNDVGLGALVATSEASESVAETAKEGLSRALPLSALLIISTDAKLLYHALGWHGRTRDQVENKK